jgi:hypothetical protein
MRKELIVLLFVLLSVISCTKVDIKDEFDRSMGLITLKSNENCPFYLVHIEKTKYEKTILLSTTSELPSEYYADLNKMFLDLVDIGQKIQVFAQKNKYQTSRILVSFAGPYGSNYVLDYSNKHFYIPKHYKEINYLYQTYQKSFINELFEIEEARKYLIKNNFIIETNGKFDESINNRLGQSLSVFITTDGKYSEYFLESSDDILFNDNNELTGKWRVTEDIDKFDDSKVIAFFLDSNEFPKKTLIIRCNKGITELYVTWEEYLGSKAYVSMRLGEGSTDFSEWNLSTDKEATFYPKNVNKLISKILMEDTLILQCIPYNDNPITLTFDISYLKNISKGYLDVLKWK